MLYIINSETIHRVAIGSTEAFNIEKTPYQNEILFKRTLNTWNQWKPERKITSDLIKKKFFREHLLKCHN